MPKKLKILGTTLTLVISSSARSVYRSNLTLIVPKRPEAEMMRLLLKWVDSTLEGHDNGWPTFLVDNVYRFDWRCSTIFMKESKKDQKDTTKSSLKHISPDISLIVRTGH